MENQVGSSPEIMNHQVYENTTIFLRDLVRKVDIGIHPHEIGQPQSVRFDIDVTIPGSDTPNFDDIAEVLNYEYLLESIESTIKGVRVSLLESLGSIILEKLMKPPQVLSATVQITKMDVLSGDGTLGCRMSRMR